MERKAKAGLGLVFLVVVVLLGRGLAFQNEPEGFRDLKWGDPPTEAMQYALEYQGQKGYIVPDDKMALGSCSLYLLVYCFWEGQFIMAGLYFKGEENFELMKTLCKQRFGEGKEKLFNTFHWQGQVSTLILQYDTLEEEGYLGMASTLLTMQKNLADEKKEAEKAEGDW